MANNKYIVLNQGQIKLSDVVNDCSNLCVPAAKGESLSSILNKICAKIKPPAFSGISQETDPIFTASPAFGISYTDISHWNSAYNNQIISAAFTGTDNKILTLTQQDGGTITANFTDLADQIVTITEGVGIDVTGTYPNFTITNTAPDQVVTLTEGSNVTITGTYPNFTIAASGGAIGTDELVKVSANDTTAGYLNGKLVQGSGILFTENNNGANETLTVAHSDTSSVANLDTSGAQVIDTLTFDTFGHVQTVTTRNLTLADLGYTVPNAMRFGVTGEDDTFAQDRLINATGVYGMQYDNLAYHYMEGTNLSYIRSEMFNASSKYYEWLMQANSGYNTGATYAAGAGSSNSGFYSAGGGGNQYFSTTSNSGTQVGQFANYRNVGGQWIDFKQEMYNDGTNNGSYWYMHREKWAGSAPFTAGKFTLDIAGASMRTGTAIGSGAGGTYKGILVDASANVRFENYPSTRNDGSTAKALYILNASGDIGYGPVTVPSSQRFGVAGEDALATADRFFDVSTFDLFIGNSTTAPIRGFKVQDGYVGAIMNDGSYKSSMEVFDAQQSLYSEETGVSTGFVNNLYDTIELISTRTGNKQAKIELLPSATDSSARLDLTFTNGLGANTFGSRVQLRNTGLSLQSSATPNSLATFKGIQIALNGNLTFNNYPNSRNDGTPTQVLYIDNANGDVKLGTLPPGGGYTVHEIDSTDSPYTVSETTGEVIILADATGGAITINVPTAVGNTAKYTFKKTDVSLNTLTIDANTTETIDGDLTQTILDINDAFTMISNNANWFVTSIKI